MTEIMKVTHKLLFVLCPMLVLVFIYYSSGKLHFYVWGQKPHIDEEPTVSLTDTKRNPNPKVTPGRIFITARYQAFLYNDEPESQDFASEGLEDNSVVDELGFLRKLDVTLPKELAYKYGNLSMGSCRPGYAAAKMTAIYPTFVNAVPMFLDRNFKKFAKINIYSPPFGIRKQERAIDKILSITKNYGLGPAFDGLPCKRCVIVGNGGILANKSLGSYIDQYDIVVRLNEAPVNGYTRDVGRKTTMRITYPEGAIQKADYYEKDSLFVLSAFKPLDLQWLTKMIFKEKLRNMEGFWKSVARYVPKEPSEMRILNPFFIQEAAFQFIGLPSNNGLMGKGNIPTLGTVAITMALHNCDEVAVAGFGYDMNNLHSPLHYWESVEMSAIKESWTHNISKEKEFLKKLVKAKVITDLTRGI